MASTSSRWRARTSSTCHGRDSKSAVTRILRADEEQPRAYRRLGVGKTAIVGPRPAYRPRRRPENLKAPICARHDRFMAALAMASSRSASRPSQRDQAAEGAIVLFIDGSTRSSAALGLDRRRQHAPSHARPRRTPASAPRPRRIPQAHGEGRRLERRFQPVTVGPGRRGHGLHPPRLVLPLELYHNVRIRRRHRSAAVLSDRHVSDRFLPDSTSTSSTGLRLDPTEMDSMPANSTSHAQGHAPEIRRPRSRSEKAGEPERSRCAGAGRSARERRRHAAVAGRRRERFAPRARSWPATPASQERAMTSTRRPNPPRHDPEIERRIEALRKRPSRSPADARCASDRDEIAESSRATGIPVKKPRVRARSSPPELHERVVGQTRLCRRSRTRPRAKAGIQNKNRPIGSFLFLTHRRRQDRWR